MRFFFAFVSLILVGCGNPPTFPLTATEDGCFFPGPMSGYIHYYKLHIKNSVGIEWAEKISSISYFSGQKRVNVNGFDNGIFESSDREGTTIYIPMISKPECGSLTPPPNENYIYDVLFIRIKNNDQTHDYIAVGGSREDYEADMLTNDKYLSVLPAGAEVLGYNFLYVPGTVLRSNLGLEPPSETHGIYSDVDSSRRTREYRNPTLTLTINGTSGNDLVWSITESE